MGSFSWNKADTLTVIENIAEHKPFKFLIPKEFGGGFIEDKYQDYGLLGRKWDGSPKYDMYELLAFWNNAKNLKYDGEYPVMKEVDDYTDYNRSKGIDIGCYDEQLLKLKYPLKLVSCSFKGAYEDLQTCSLRDPDQGFFPRKRKLKKPELELNNNSLRTEHQDELLLKLENLKQLVLDKLKDV